MHTCFLSQYLLIKLFLQEDFDKDVATRLRTTKEIDQLYLILEFHYRFIIAGAKK